LLDGAELVFSPGPNRLNVVRVTTQPTFTFSEATPMLLPFQTSSPSLERPSDIIRDGRFLGLIDAAQAQAAPPDAPQIQVVLN